MDRRLAAMKAQFSNLPEPIRASVKTLVKVAGPKLIKVRKPRDLKKLMKDPTLIKALGRDLEPVINTIIDAAAKAPAPISGRVTTHISATVTGAGGAAVANWAELGALFGGPETLALTAPTAFGIQAAATAWETYVEFSVIVNKLRAAGINDPERLRLAAIRTLVPDATDVTKLVVVRGGERLAVRLLTRTAAGWVPLAGPIFGVVRANIDLHRAHVAAESVIREAALAERRSDFVDEEVAGVLGAGE